MVWKIRDELNANCPLTVLRQMLEENGFSSQGGEASVSYNSYTVVKATFCDLIGRYNYLVLQGNLGST